MNDLMRSLQGLDNKTFRNYCKDHNKSTNNRTRGECRCDGDWSL